MISTTEWILTIVLLSVVICLDLLVAVLRRNKETSTLEASFWTAFYIGAAIVFGTLMPRWSSQQASKEFFAGWLTEYALSVDNIFVFIIILATLKIERQKQQLVLLLGILLTIAIRGLLIPAGATVITHFGSVFFLFGAFLIYTAYSLATENGEDEWKEGKAVALLRSRGFSTFTIALVALGLTNLLFSLDSIPAIFGLTKDPYVVTTANVFALMGLRQLYFLLESLLARLVYLSKGLSFILAFIGVKMIFEAFIHIHVTEIGGIKVPEISLEVSLGTIIISLAVTAAASLFSTRSSKESVPL